MSDKNWASNEIQFPRLLAEVCAVGLSEQQYNELSASMDLPIASVDEIFDRAEAEFQKNKSTVLDG